MFGVNRNIDHWLVKVEVNKQLVGYDGQPVGFIDVSVP